MDLIIIMAHLDKGLLDKQKLSYGIIFNYLNAFKLKPSHKEHPQVEIEMSTEFEAIKRSRVPELEAILGKSFKVLDDGFVRLVDYMGSDESIVQAARVSYGKGTKKISQDRGLIRYLMRNRHTTPLEMCELKIHVRVPMDCWRQWIRHRTANVNEYSTRYSLAIDAMRTTQPDQWRLQASDNKQGSEGTVDVSAGEDLTSRETEFHQTCKDMYQYRLEQGVAREQARKDLPLSTYTEAYWKIDLHNLLHFLALRMDSHAQYEIREFAHTIGHKIVSQWVPLSWEAFLDYRLDATYLSGPETRLLSLVAKNQPDQALKLAREINWVTDSEQGLKLNREAQEFSLKLEKMDLKAPW